MQYAKAVVAVIGAAITAALGIVPPDTDLWAWLTVLSAAITAVAVYQVPNVAAGRRRATDWPDPPGTL